ncbi:unnamed protein product [Strongylus vulgaris]|uniref:Uncharacterized protein n=1 Tax=Strongylus vulgaris TaxID=40348 RepID=A0A3P7JBL7_STRVU|nr:unnamed protein product [Strongylus vulgaris]
MTMMATVANVASSTSTIYENISDSQSSNHLEDLKLEDSGTYDADSRSNSNEKCIGFPFCTLHGMYFEQLVPTNFAYMINYFIVNSITLHQAMGLIYVMVFLG